MVGVYELNNLVKALFACDQDIDPDLQGRTPLSWAAEIGHTEVVQALLYDKWADPNGQDNDGQTPLSWAVENGQTEVVTGLSWPSQVNETVGLILDREQSTYHMYNFP
jgi:FOG: Ankyrin repeat